MEHAKARPFVRFSRRLVSLSACAYPFTLRAQADLGRNAELR
jgi:hypothetical protein